MANNYEVFNTLIEEIKAKEDIDEAEIAKRIKRNHGYISQIRSRYRKDMEQPSDKIIEILKLHFLTKSEETQSNNYGKEANLVVGGNEEIKDLEMKALLDITKIYAESHVGLVRSHENLTIAHKHALEDNSLLTSMVERKIYTNSDGAKENQAEPSSEQPPLLMRLADGGVGTFWKTRGEGLLALGNMLTVEELAKR